MKLLNFK
jgi:hypothetical protein